MLLALRLAGAAPAGAAAHLVAAGELPDGVTARVRLLPTATVRGAAIRLGEIAVIEASDERLLRLLDRKLSRLLPREPAPGRPLTRRDAWT